MQRKHGDARNGERQQATRKTGKEVVRRHCIDWCGCSLPAQFSWQTTDNRGEESLASTAHMGHELMMMTIILLDHFFNLRKKSDLIGRH